jgi:glycosyltransferase involved in cell wall biosynthesis
VIAQLTHPNVRLRCVSHELQTRLLALAPILASQITVEPCRITVDQAPTRSQARSDLNLSAEEAIVLIVARMIPSKRVDVSLRALNEMPTTGHHSRFKVVVIGDGPQMQPLSQRYPFAHFLGAQPRSQTLRWMAAADVLLSASSEEGAPTVVREARALGVPVVCAKAGDLATWAQQDSAIHLFDAPESIAGIVSEVVGAASCSVE